MISPPNLKNGDKVAIAVSARRITRKEMLPAIRILEQQGLEVIIDEKIYSIDNQFAGNDQVRAQITQNYLDDPEIKALFFARGGYGSVRIVDLLDFGSFCINPCWLVGYSDITVLLNHVSRNHNVQTMHASMPINFGSNTAESLETMFNYLKGNYTPIKTLPNKLNIVGFGEGEIVGGNLSVLYSLLSSDSFPDTEGKILFLEDLDEYLYHIDRMMVALKRAGKLCKLDGLIVGGMTGMNDNAIPFGKSADEIVLEHVKGYEYPVSFGFPAGHMDNNLPLVMGKRASIVVDSNESRLEYL